MLSKKRIPELGPLEFRLLRILWKCAPAAARDVLEFYNRKSDRKLKYTTVMTLLPRMTEKGVVEVDGTRRPFQFIAAVSREQMLRQRVQEFVDVFFEGEAVDLAVRLVEDTPLSEDSLRRLEESLRRHREGQEDSGFGES